MTMLRLWVIGAAVWMGGVLVMGALRNLGAGGARDWLIGGAVTLAFLLVLLANVFDVEAFVVRHNVGRAVSGSTLDLVYVASLSDDAVPAIGDAIQHAASSSERRSLRTALHCTDRADGVATLNVAVARADDVRRRWCPSVSR